MFSYSLMNSNKKRFSREANTAMELRKQLVIGQITKRVTRCRVNTFLSRVSVCGTISAFVANKLSHTPLKKDLIIFCSAETSSFLLHIQCLLF